MPYKHLPKQFQGIVEATEYKEPDVDISEDMRTFVDGAVVQMPKEQQLHAIKEFVRNRVVLELGRWKNNYIQNDEIIENMTNHHNQNEQDISRLSNEIQELKKSEESIHAEKYANQQKLKKLQKYSTNSDPNKKFTIGFFMVAALALAILTLVEFATSMSVVNEVLSGEKTTSNMVMIFALGAAAILVGGKLISVLYEYIGYNRLFFIGVTVVALLAVVATTYTTSDNKAFADGNKQLQADVARINNALNDAVFIETLEDSDEDGVPTVAAKEAKAKQQKLLQQLSSYEEKLNTMKSRAIQLNKNTIWLVFLTELFIGGVIWMYVADYSRRTNRAKTDHELKILAEHLEQNEKELEKIREEIQGKEEEIELLRLENHDLHRVISLIYPEEKIEKIIEAIIENETNMALAHLGQSQEA
jgi:cytoskeletal protein RodZ